MPSHPALTTDFFLNQVITVPVIPAVYKVVSVVSFMALQSFEKQLAYYALKLMR